VEPGQDAYAADDPALYLTAGHDPPVIRLVVVGLSVTDEVVVE